MLEKSSFLKRSASPEGRTLDLDQARVASMADEGGASGAVMDAQEQGEPLEIEIAKLQRWTPWVALGLVAGCAAFAGALFALSRTRSRPRGFRAWFA